MKTLKLIKLLCASVCMAFVATGVLYAQSPYGWRGAHRDGIYEETGLLKVWPAMAPSCYGLPWMRERAYQSGNSERSFIYNGNE